MKIIKSIYSICYDRMNGKKYENVLKMGQVVQLAFDIRAVVFWKWQDLRDIFEFIAEDNPKAARSLLADVTGNVKLTH